MPAIATAACLWRNFRVVVEAEWPGTYFAAGVEVAQPTMGVGTLLHVDTKVSTSDALHAYECIGLGLTLRAAVREREREWGAQLSGQAHGTCRCSSQGWHRVGALPALPAPLCAAQSEMPALCAWKSGSSFHHCWPA